MEFGLDRFLCWQTGVLGIVIYGLTLGIRTVMELWQPSLTDRTRKLNAWWTNVLIPLIPIIIGVALCGCIRKTFPWPEGLGRLWGRLMYGFVCSVSASKIYQLVWGTLKSRLPPDAVRTITLPMGDR